MYNFLQNFLWFLYVLRYYFLSQHYGVKPICRFSCPALSLNRRTFQEGHHRERYSIPMEDFMEYTFSEFFLGVHSNWWKVYYSRRKKTQLSFKCPNKIFWFQTNANKCNKVFFRSSLHVTSSSFTVSDLTT